MALPAAGQTATMDHRSLARLGAAGRVAVGAALLVAPQRVTSGWTGEDGATPGGRLLGRALGARDLVLGLGVIGALGRGDPAARDWIRASAVADTVDAVATTVALRNVPTRSAAAILLLAAGSAVAGFVAAEHLDD
jgi:hypothetical protein